MHTTHGKIANRRVRAKRKSTKRQVRSDDTGQPPDSVEIRQWRSELNYFLRIRSKLWNDRAYRDRFVAIKDKKIIDVGTDQFDLARKWMKQHPGEVVFVTKVELEPRRIHLPDMRVR